MYVDVFRDGAKFWAGAEEAGQAAYVQVEGHSAIDLHGVHARNPRVVLTLDGRRLGCWKGGNGIPYGIDFADGRPFALWQGGMIPGDENVALTPGGKFVFIASRTHYSFDGQLRELPGSRIGTSQGIAEAYDDGTVVFGDDQRYAPESERRLGPFMFVQWQDLRDESGVLLWRVGKTDRGSIAWHFETQKAWTVSTEPTNWSIRSILLGGVPMCAISGPGLFVGAGGFARWPPPVVVPEFKRCIRRMAVGAYFDVDRPCLTVPDDERFPQSGRTARGVMMDDSASAEAHRRAASLAADYLVDPATGERTKLPLYGYGDGYGKNSAWGDYAILHAYLTPGSDSASCLRLLRQDIAAAKDAGRKWGLCLGLHLGATDTPGVYKRDLQETLLHAQAVHAVGVDEGARFIYVFSWRQPATGPIRDGILRLPETIEAYDRIRASVPDPDDWPTMAEAVQQKPKPVEKPPAAEPRPDPLAFRRTDMAEKQWNYYVKAFNESPVWEECGRPGDPNLPEAERRAAFDVTPREMFLCLPPGASVLEWRDVAGSWERVSVSQGSRNELFVEFVAGESSLSFEQDDRIGLRPKGTRGSYESFIGGFAPTGDGVLIRCDKVGQDTRVLRLVREAA